MRGTIPTFDCKDGCSDCCKAILVGKREWAAIVKRVGRPLYIKQDVITCPLLKDGRCSVYDIRPTVCRLFGAVEDLRCPRGCGPEKLLTHDQGAAIFWKTVKDGYVGG